MIYIFVVLLDRTKQESKSFNECEVERNIEREKHGEMMNLHGLKFIVKTCYTACNVGTL